MQAVREGQSSGQEVFSPRPRLEPARPDCAVRGETSSQEKLNWPAQGPASSTLTDCRLSSLLDSTRPDITVTLESPVPPPGQMMIMVAAVLTTTLAGEEQTWGSW